MIDSVVCEKQRSVRETFDLWMWGTATLLLIQSHMAQPQPGTHATKHEQCDVNAEADNGSKWITDQIIKQDANNSVFSVRGLVERPNIFELFHFVHS